MSLTLHQFPHFQRKISIPWGEGYWFATEIGSAPFNIQHLALLFLLGLRSRRASHFVAATSLFGSSNAQSGERQLALHPASLATPSAPAWLTIYFELFRRDLISAASCFALLASTTLLPSSTWDATCQWIFFIPSARVFKLVTRIEVKAFCAFSHAGR